MKLFRALAWGCGVQSTTLAVMSAEGELPPLDVVMTADTGWERARTYWIRDFYTEWLRTRGVRVEVVKHGNVRELGGKRHMHMPLWTERTEDFSGGPLSRECSRYFKVRPARRALRKLLGFDPSKPPAPPAGAIEQWIGFSIDEWERMKDSPVQYIKSRFPLIEKRLSRNDCLDYLESKGLPIPIKSACVGCPYRLPSEWLKMQQEAPTEFADAVAFDESIRELDLDGLEATRLYVYKHRVPLAEANFEADARRERAGKQLPLMICGGDFCLV